MGPLGHEANEFLTDLGRRLSLITDNVRETSHLFQRVSVLTQRYNAVAFRGSRHCFNFAFNPRDLYYRGFKNK